MFSTPISKFARAGHEFGSCGSDTCARRFNSPPSPVIRPQVQGGGVPAWGRAPAGTAWYRRVFLSGFRMGGASSFATPAVAVAFTIAKMPAHRTAAGRDAERSKIIARSGSAGSTDSAATATSPAPTRPETLVFPEKTGGLQPVSKSDAPQGVVGCSSDALRSGLANSHQGLVGEFDFLPGARTNLEKLHQAAFFRPGRPAARQPVRVERRQYKYVRDPKYY